MKKNSSNQTLRRVALLVETTRSYTRDILAGVNRYMQAHSRWSTFLELRSLDSSFPPWLEKWDGDGILSRTHSQKMANAISSTGIPVVELRSTNYQDNIPFVGVDNSMIGEAVAEHFLSRGYRRFGAYTLDTEVFFKERVNNFVTKIKGSGLHCDILPSAGDATIKDWERHQKEIIKWLNSLVKPVAIFATNDQLAVRLIDACQRAGISVPEDVAVVGCENEETLCEFSSPRLTSVRLDGKTVGFRAAELLNQLMEGNTPDKNRIYIPPKGIEIRASSDEFVIEDPIVLRAARLIREKAFTGLTVADICKHVGASRSTLERRMKASLNRNPKEEILRVRFKEINRLLRNTDFTIDTISELTGFSYPHYLQAIYKERYGMTPGEYRKKL